MSAKITKLPSAERPHIGPTSEVLEQSELKAHKNTRLITIISTGISLIWLGLCIGYMDVYLGWDLFNQMLPHQLGAGLVGVFSPLVFVWLIALYTKRAHDVRYHTDVLRRQLALLTYGAEESDQRINLIANALRSQTDELNDASGRAFDILTKLTGTLEERTGDLANVAERIDNDAGIIRDKLANQTEQLNGLNDRMESQHLAITQSVDRQTEELTNASKIALDNSDQINAALRLQVSDVINASDQAADQARNIGGLFDKYTHVMRTTSDNALSKAKEIDSIFKSSGEMLGDTTAAVSSHASDITKQLGDTVHQLEKHLKETFNKQATAISVFTDATCDQVDRLGDAMGNHANTFAGQLHETIKDQTGRLHSSISDNAALVDEITKSLHQQTTDLSQTAEKSARQVNSIKSDVGRQNDILKILAESLADQSARVNKSVDMQSEGLVRASCEATEKVSAMTLALNDASLGATKRAQDITNAMSHQMGTLESAANIVNQRLDQAGAAFRNESIEMKRALKTTLNLIEDVSDRFRMQAQKLTSVSVHAGMQITDNRDALKKQAQELADTARLSADSLGLVGDAFALQADGMNATTDSITQRLQDLTDMIHAKSNGIVKAGDQANQQITLVGRNITQHSKTLTQTAVNTRSTLDDISEQLANSTQQLNEAVDVSIAKTSQASAEFSEQTNALNQAANAADEQAKILAQEELSSKRNLFLKTTRFIIEDLNSISIDLTRILNNEVPDTDWKRYVKGDRGIFTRNLLRTKTASMVSKIQARMKTDHDARQYVTRYIEQFDRLLEACKESDPESLMHSTFLTSDVGKLFILLTRASGRTD